MNRLKKPLSVRKIFVKVIGKKNKHVHIKNKCFKLRKIICNIKIKLVKKYSKIVFDCNFSLVFFFQTKLLISAIWNAVNIKWQIYIQTVFWCLSRGTFFLRSWTCKTPSWQEILKILSWVLKIRPLSYRVMIKLIYHFVFNMPKNEIDRFHLSTGFFRR